MMPIGFCVRRLCHFHQVYKQQKMCENEFLSYDENQIKIIYRS